MRVRAFVSSLVGITMLIGGISPASSLVGTLEGVGSACTPGTPAEAARTLYGSGTEVVRADQVAGLQTVLAMEPYIAPGTRHRMIAVSGGWCDAETGFNTAWLANGLSLSASRAMATAYSRLAAAPYFDQTDAVSYTGAGGVHTIRTHSLTNGIEALWTIVTDADGVRSARWVATDYAVEPFVAQWEGLTALNGANETYTRLASGELAAERGLPTGEIDPPEAQVSFTGPDGFTIVVGIGDSRNAVDIGQDTGNSRADILRMTRDVVGDNYLDFYAWGLRADWAPARTRFVVINSPGQIPAPEKTGYVSINDGTSAYCQACVFIADDFQVHIVSEVRVFLEALGYTYPGVSDRDVLSDVMGHEMFHNWQNNYVKPAATGRSVPGSYSEGTARMQEALHAYSGGSHQPGSLVYANDGNGCNGYHGTNPTATLAAGPFNGAYAACNFWLPWYGAEGVGALAKLVIEGAPLGAEASSSSAGKMIPAVELATGEPFTVSGAEWAAGLITGKNLTWGPATGSGPTYDWSQYLERWTPAQLAIGNSATRTLAGGGVMAVEASASFRPRVTEGAGLAILRDSAAGASLTFPDPGTLVQGPANGERVYVIAVYPQAGSLSTTLDLLAP